MSEEFVIGALVGQIGIVILAAIARYFIPAYIGQKGKNLATKEDIGGITRIVEDIRVENAKIIEQVRSRNRLRTLAIERRLEVHQQAYALWLGLSRALFDPEENKQHVRKCSDFWTGNCIYLSPEASKAFTHAFGAALHHKELVDMYRGTGDEAGMQHVKDNHKAITDAGNIILGEMELPPLTENILEDLGIKIDGGD